MALASSTLRPGLLVSLKTSVRGNVHYFRKDLGAKTADDGKAAIENWETERVIDDPKEHEAAGKARGKASSLVRSVCKKSAFGLLCPAEDQEKLEAAVVEARKVVDDFNAGSTMSSIDIFVLTGRVSPDDVEAVRAINSEIRELMSEMSKGIEGSDVEAIRDAASKVKGIGEMLSMEAKAKVTVAVEAARKTATNINNQKKDGGTIEIDLGALRRIKEASKAFLDMDDVGAVAAPKERAQQLDLVEAE